MTNPTMDCDQFADTLADLLERDVPEAARAAVEAHALACADCGPLLADLRKLRVDAANLPELAPSRDLWTGISERIETPVVALGGQSDAWRSASTTGARRRSSVVWMGLAAAGLVAVSAGSTYLLTRHALVAPVAPVAQTAKVPTHDAAQPTAAASSPLPALANQTTTPRPDASSSGARPAQGSTTRLVSNKPTADETYDLEISRLRSIVNARRSQLDSGTVAVVDKNLHIIDDAIVQCRMALRKDPASAYLIESLNQALDSKVQLLRTAAGLPTRM
jgi:hypothetical protein